MLVLLLLIGINCDEIDWGEIVFDKPNRLPYISPFPFIVQQTITIIETGYGQIPKIKQLYETYEPYIEIVIPKGYYIIFSWSAAEGYFEIKTNDGYLYRKYDNTKHILTTFGSDYSGKIYIRTILPLYYYAVNSADLDGLSDCRLVASCNLDIQQFDQTNTKFCIFDPNLQNFSYTLKSATVEINYKDPKSQEVKKIQQNADQFMEDSFGPAQFSLSLEITRLDQQGFVMLKGGLSEKLLYFPSSMPKEYQSYSYSSGSNLYVDPFKQSKGISFTVPVNEIEYTSNINKSEKYSSTNVVVVYVRNSVEFQLLDIYSASYYFDAGTNNVSGSITLLDDSVTNVYSLNFYSGNYDNFSIELIMNDFDAKSYRLYDINFRNESIQSIPKIKTTINFANMKDQKPRKIHKMYKFGINAHSNEIQTMILSACEPFKNLTDFEVLGKKLTFKAHYSFESDILVLDYEMELKNKTNVGMIVGIVVAVVVVIVVAVIVIMYVIKRKKTKQISDNTTK